MKFSDVAWPLANALVELNTGVAQAASLNSVNVTAPVGLTPVTVAVSETAPPTVTPGDGVAERLALARATTTAWPGSPHAPASAALLASPA